MPVKTIPKNNDGGWYYPNGKAASLGIQPGDIIELEGDYAYINLDGLAGTPEAPIIFRPKAGTIVRVGVNNSYAWIMMNCKHFIIDGTTTAGKYGFKIGGPVKGQYIAQSFTFPTSDNFEIKNVELLNAQVGFFGNPKIAGSGPFKNIKIHDNYVHDLDNPMELGRSEGVYLGRTDVNSRTIGGSFENVEIYNNIFEGLAGDGIQVALTKNVYIHDNQINGYGRANLEQQRSGIIIGGCTSGRVENNKVNNGTGAGLQIFGGGEVIVKNNLFDNVATSPNEDGIYIDGKCQDEKLTVRLTGNVITNKPARDIFRDVANYVIENTGNSWNGVAPVPTPPTPSPTQVDKGYYTNSSGKRIYWVMYDNHTWKETNSKYVPL